MSRSRAKVRTYHALLGDIKTLVDTESDPPVVYLYGEYESSGPKTGIMVQGVMQLTRLLQALHFAHRQLKPEPTPAIEPVAEEKSAR